MPWILNRQQSREVDRRCVEEYGLPSIALMENAGRGAADLLRSLGIDGHVVICCGKGNNGGDGLVVARHLDLHQVPTRVLLWADPESLHGDAATNYLVLEKSGVPIDVVLHDASNAWKQHLEAAAWIVDGLLGTGATGEPRPPLDAAIDAINAAQTNVLALDVPSGLDCDTGTAAQHTIRATHTATFLARKPAFSSQDTSRYTGTVHVLDIGAPRKLIEEVAAQS